MDPLSRELRQQSEYWATKFADAADLITALQTGHFRISNAVGGDGVPGMISHLKGEAHSARSQLEFLARLPARQKR
jgi:hypothetical protein